MEEGTEPARAYSPFHGPMSTRPPPAFTVGVTPGGTATAVVALTVGLAAFCQHAQATHHHEGAAPDANWMQIVGPVGNDGREIAPIPISGM